VHEAIPPNAFELTEEQNRQLHDAVNAGKLITWIPGTAPYAVERPEPTPADYSELDALNADFREICGKIATAIGAEFMGSFGDIKNALNSGAAKTSDGQALINALNASFVACSVKFRELGLTYAQWFERVWR
jgi:hypothetical protein